MGHHFYCVNGVCDHAVHPMLMLGLMTQSAGELSPVRRTNGVINAHLAVNRAQARHVIQEKGLDDGVAEQLRGWCDAQRVLLSNQLALCRHSNALQLDMKSSHVLHTWADELREL